MLHAVHLPQRRHAPGRIQVFGNCGGSDERALPEAFAPTWLHMGASWQRIVGAGGVPHGRATWAPPSCSRACACAPSASRIDSRRDRPDPHDARATRGLRAGARRARQAPTPRSSARSSGQSSARASRMLVALGEVQRDDLHVADDRGLEFRGEFVVVDRAGELADEVGADGDAGEEHLLDRTRVRVVAKVAALAMSRRDEGPALRDEVVVNAWFARNLCDRRSACRRTD